MNRRQAASPRRPEPSRRRALHSTLRVNQLQFAVGGQAGYGLFAQDWTGVSSPALLRALQGIQQPTGPGV